MKILHINCNYMTTELHQTMTEILGDTGVDNTVFVPMYDRKLAVIEPNDNVIVRECFRKLDRLNFYKKQSKIIQSVEESLDVSQYDCIHAYTMFTDGNCAMELAKKYHLPYVVAVRNTDVNTFLKYIPHLRKKGIEILKCASAIFFLSPAYQKTVFEKYVPEVMKPELSRKTFVVPNGINRFWFQNNLQRDYFAITDRFRHKEMKAIYVGRINRHKNITAAQKALALLRKEGWSTELAVVGGIDDKREYRRIAKDENTKYFSKKTMSELVELYKKYDVFIMPSHIETFGLVYAEAMSQGLPVIYTKNQGFDEQFPEGYVGHAVNDKDIEGIALAIKSIVKVYEKTSKNAIEGAKKFKWEDICDMYKQVYYRVVTASSIQRIDSKTDGA